MQKLAEICVNRPVFATMLILALTVAGAFSYFSLGVDRFPKVDFPVITVTVANPGSSPAEIETEITDKIEAAVNTISGIKELRSTSVEGVSQVFIQFNLDKNFDVAAQEVRDKVNLVISDLPNTIETPTVQKFETNSSPVMQVAVAAPRPLVQVTDIAKKLIKERIENIPGIGQVRIIGGNKREIKVLVNPDRMRAYGVSAVEVVEAVRRQNLEVPGGRIPQGSQEFTLRTLGKLLEVPDFETIPVIQRGDFVVRLRDIATIEDGTEEQRSLSLLNGQPAVTLLISKRSGENTVAVIGAVKERLEEIRPTLPSDVTFQIVSDQSVFVEAAVNDVKTHLFEGSLLACLIVFLFLWRFGLTLIAGIAIPISIIGTFALMAAFGYTLDIITLLALTLMVGVVIDDAIVVLENIERFIREKGFAPFPAAIEATREIGLAVLATTLSLMAVFIPTAFMGGIVGRFLAPFGLTAAASVGISMLVSFTLTPMLCARILKPHSKEDGHEAKTPADRWFGPVERWYTHLLHWSMAHRKTVIAVCVLVIVSVVPIGGMVGGDFIALDDESQFEINLRMPEGTTLAQTSTLLERVAADLRALPGVTDTLTTIGSGEQQEANNAYIYVKLRPIHERDTSQAELIVKARELLARSPKEWRISLQAVPPFSGGGYRNSTVQYVLNGPDLEKLGLYADTLKEQLKKIPNLVDIDSTLALGQPEVRAVIDRQRAADLGVAVEDIATSLNIFVAGVEASRLTRGNDQFEVRVRALEARRIKPEQLAQMTVPSTRSGSVPLENVVSFVESRGPAVIERLNRQRQVTLLANIAPGGSLSEVTTQIDQVFAGLELEPGYSRVLAGDAKELNDAAFYFVLAFALTFIFMYIVLAAQFESFIHPVTILLTLPLAIPFGLLSLLVTGQSLNIFSGLGLLVLFAVVKKNAILQIDHTNGLRAKGMDRLAAILQANRERLRPILMTTIAFVAGMLPLILATGPGAGTNRSIGVLVVGGQTLCLLLTLVAVPVFYSVFDDWANWAGWKQIGEVWARFFSSSRKPKAAEALKVTTGLMLALFLVCSPILAQEPNGETRKHKEVRLEPGTLIMSSKRKLHIPGLVLAGLTQPQETPPLPATPAVTPEPQREPLSLTPERAIELAVKNNLQTILAQEQREEVQGRVWQSLSALLPNVSGRVGRFNASVNLAAQGFPPELLAGQSAVFAYDTFDARLELVQTLFSLSAIRRYQSSQIEKKIADSQLVFAKEQVTNAALLGYLELVRAEQSVKAAQANVELARSLLKLAQNQRDAGLATALDVVRAGTRLSDEEVKLVQAETNAERARLGLLRVTGLPLDQNLVLTSELRYLPETLPEEQKAIESALTERLEVQIASQELKRQELDQKASQADWTPSVEAVADYGLSGPRPGQLTLPTRTFGVRVNVPIFDGGATYGRILESTSRKRQALAQLADVQTQVKQDVRLAVKTLALAGTQLTSAEQGLSLAQRELELARERFEVGLGDNIEVTNAQTALANARDVRIQALYQYTAARINLAAALGRIEAFQW